MLARFFVWVVARSGDDDKQQEGDVLRYVSLMARSRYHAGPPSPRRAFKVVEPNHRAQGGSRPDATASPLSIKRDRLSPRRTAPTLRNLHPPTTVPPWRRSPSSDHRLMMRGRLPVRHVTTARPDELPAGQVSHPTPSLFPSKPCGSVPTTVKFVKEIWPQSRSGGGSGMHTVGYEG